jgi:signal peptidase I
MHEVENATRRAARQRSIWLPGAGLALLGYSFLAGLSLACSVLALTAIVAMCFSPGTLTAWVVFVALDGVVLFWVAEYVALGRIPIRPSGDSNRVDMRFAWACGLFYTGVIAAAVCVFLNFASVTVHGRGMIPVVNPGECVVYHKRVVPADLVPGHVIVFQLSAESSLGQPGAIFFGRILAASGDVMQIRDGLYRVNGQEKGAVGPVGQYQVVAEVPEAPAQLIVPPDCFFVVQEQRSTAFDSRTLSWVHREDVLGTRLWLVALRGLGRVLR